MPPTLTIPGELLIAPFKMLRRGVNGRIIVTRMFQKRLGEMAMSRFIAWSGHSIMVSDTADTLWEAIIKAYIYFIGLPFILCWAGEQIYRTPILRAYFEQWAVVKDFFALREAQKWKQVENQDWSSYRDFVLSKTGYSKSLFDLFNPRQPLLNVERYKSARLLEIQDDQKLTDEQVCELPSQMLKETAEPSLFFTLQKEAVPLASVLIGMDVTIILANIQLLELYRRVISIEYDAIHIPAWLKYQSTRVTDTAGFFRKIYFDDYGKVSVSIPHSDTFPHTATLDTYSLKLILNLPEMRHLLTEPWGDYLPPPAMLQALMEIWSIGAPPEMAQALLEAWTFMPTPPEMAQTLLEPWGVPCPTMSQKLLEKWGEVTPPPTMSRKVLEQWSS